MNIQVMTSSYRSMFRLIIAATLIVLLTACDTGPQLMGIDHLLWDSMTDNQRRQVINNYEKIQKHVKQSHVQDHDDIIHVKISKGWSLMPPFDDYYHYRPVKMRLEMGECRAVEISAKDTPKHVPLLACYQDQGLYLDPGVHTQKDQPGSIYIPRSPMWQWGHCYNNVTSQGIVRLLRAQVCVQSKGALKNLSQPQVVDHHASAN